MTDAQTAAGDLLGLWEATLRFGPDVRGQLILLQTAEGWRADIGDSRLPRRFMVGRSQTLLRSWPLRAVRPAGTLVPLGEESISSLEAEGGRRLGDEPSSARRGLALSVRPDRSKHPPPRHFTELGSP
jgi:hypothetical protein